MTQVIKLDMFPMKRSQVEFHLGVLAEQYGISYEEAKTLYQWSQLDYIEGISLMQGKIDRFDVQRVPFETVVEYLETVYGGQNEIES